MSTKAERLLEDISTNGDLTVDGLELLDDTSGRIADAIERIEQRIAPVYEDTPPEDEEYSAEEISAMIEGRPIHG